LIDLIRRLLHTLTDVEGMIRWGGYAGLAAIIFSETGLMVGFFLPGDSLLVAAGLFAARGTLNIFWLWLLLIPMAILGNSTGYAIGRRLGKALFARKSSRLFNHRHLIRTQLFYEQHGGKAVSFAQFLPIFRTFTPVVAGIATMRYRRFVSFNVLGAICWVISMTVVGYALGRTFPQVAKRIELVMIVVIAVSFIPAAISGWRARRAKLRSRSVFLSAMSDLVQRLGSLAWDGSPTGIHRLAAELSAPHGSRAVDGPQPAVEMLAAQSTPLAELSDAAGEVAGWELEERYTQARAALCSVYGEPREEESPGSTPSGPRSMPTRTATWRAPQGVVTLQQRCDPDRHRLAVRVEPAA
jgi:membrane-associated protein